MDSTGAELANPWVPYVFLGAAVLVTLTTVGVQLRALSASVRGWRADADRPAAATVLLAGSVGLASIAGAVVAVTAGGPGALVWMWLATLLGMALHHTEARRAAESPDGAPFVSGHLGPLGKLLAAAFCLAFIPFALLAGGMLQTQQTGAIVRLTGTMDIPVAAAILGMLALPFALVPRWRTPLLRVATPVALIGYCVVALGVALEDSLLLEFAVADAFAQAFAAGPAVGGVAGGAIAVAAYHGVTRAMLAGEVGLGTASLATPPGGSSSARAAAAMLVPFVTVSTVATVTALAVLSSPAEPAPITEGRMVPLERALSRGLRPSQQVGQTVVMPEDAGVEPSSYYAMMMRSSPRGHPFAKLLRKENAILLPQWAITEGIDHVLFRSRDAELAAQGAWDVRVDCKVDVIDGKGGPNLLRLVPTDENLDLERLISFYELDPQPYVPVGDFHFTGRVATAQSPDPELGTHLAMYEAPAEDRPFNPKFHEFFRGGYRGPYPDSEAPRPPWGWAATEALADDARARVGQRVRLRFRGDPRGEAVVRINRAGGAEAPPWDIMMKVRQVVVRHDTDASQDVVVEVTPRLDGYRIRLEANDPKWEDFRRIDTMEHMSGPFARIGDVEFDAEIHSGIRLLEGQEDRLSVVPLHDQLEPIGPFGALPYAPHPGELAAAGMAGPYLVDEGTEVVATRFAERYGPSGRWLLALVAVVFGLSTIAVYAGYASRCAGYLLGGWAETPARIAVVIAAACGGALAFDVLLSWVDVCMAIVLVPNVLALVLVRGRAEAPTAGGTGDGATPPADA